MNETMTAINGIRVGHATNLEGATGCTVVLCPPETVGGVDVRGGAPGTRETDLLQPHNHVEEVNAIFLSGGSAYGLAVADGIVRYLEEKKEGYMSGGGFIVPIVAGAILYDLPVGKVGIRPDAEMGYQACENASNDPVEQGTIGAGTGARIGGMRGNEYATKGGIGSACIRIDDDMTVTALVAVNAVGDVIDEQGEILAGLRVSADSDEFVGMLDALKSMARMTGRPKIARENTVIGVVATNARLSKAHVNKVAQMAHDGIARAIKPAHTMFDGDTMFALATGEIEANPTVIGAYGAEAVSQAIWNGIRNATSLHGIRAWNE